MRSALKGPRRILAIRIRFGFASALSSLSSLLSLAQIRRRALPGFRGAFFIFATGRPPPMVSRRTGVARPCLLVSARDDAEAGFAEAGNLR